MKSEDCPGLSVTLQVNGADLLEYAVGEDGDEADTSKRYVEVVAGSKFSVGIRYDRAFLYLHDTIEVRAWLDGQYADGICSNPKKRRSGQVEAIDGINSVQNGRWVIQKLQFAALKTDDGLPKASMNDTLKELGTIRVECRRGRERRIPAGNESGAKFEPRKSEGVPEKCLKGRAISSHATVCEAIPIATPRFSTMEFPYGKDAIATFHFLYRSHKDLQIEGVIPRSPTPVPVEERDPDSLTLEEAREVVRRNRERDAARVQIKQEFKKEKRSHAEVIEDDETVEDDPEVSFEGKKRKRSRNSRDSGVEIVDLCGDGDRSAKLMKPGSVASLGEVKVHCIWICRAGAPQPLVGQSSFKPAAGESIPEKCLMGRAISHTAKLGEAKACIAQTAQNPEYPYGRQPFATFAFKYRSKRDIQIEGVIARIPSPPPLEDRDLDSLTAEEARELVRRMHAQQDEQVRITREKRARSVVDDDDALTNPGRSAIANTLRHLAIPASTWLT